MLSNGKIVKVIPVHKSGDRNKVCNYHLIWLTSFPGKLREHIIVSNVTSYLENFFENQHGFRKGFTWKTIEFTNLFRRADSNFQTDCILISFSKAFEYVAHRALVENLYSIDSLAGSEIGHFASNSRSSMILYLELLTFRPVYPRR